MMLWADGFDHYGDATTLSQNYNYSGGFFINTDPDYVRTATSSLCVSKGSNFISFQRPVISTPAEIVFGFGFIMIANLGAQNFNCVVNNSSSTTQFNFIVNSLGQIVLFRGATQLGSTAGAVITQGVYAFIEVKALVHNTTGYIEIHVNGDQEILFTGDTSDGGTANVGFIGWQEGNFEGGLRWAVDDYYIADTTGTHNNDFLGEIRCRPMFTITDGPLQDWTGTDSPACDGINLVPPDIDNHNITTSSSPSDSNFGHTQLPITTAYVNAIVMHVFASKTDTGPVDVTPQLSSNGTVGSGDTFSPTQTPAWYAAVFDVDPDTNSTFTLAGAQAALLQVERSS